MVKREKANSLVKEEQRSSEGTAIKVKRVSKREKKTHSYANMANGIDPAEHMDYSADFMNHYSRTSLIRTSSIDEDHEDQYQEQPVDFSAKRNTIKEEVMT